MNMCAGQIQSHCYQGQPATKGTWLLKYFTWLANHKISIGQRGTPLSLLHLSMTNGSIGHGTHVPDRFNCGASVRDQAWKFVDLHLQVLVYTDFLNLRQKTILAG